MSCDQHAAFDWLSDSPTPGSLSPLPNPTLPSEAIGYILGSQAGQSYIPLPDPPHLWILNLARTRQCSSLPSHQVGISCPPPSFSQQGRCHRPVCKKLRDQRRGCMGGGGGGEQRMLGCIHHHLLASRDRHHPPAEIPHNGVYRASSALSPADSPPKRSPPRPLRLLPPTPKGQDGIQGTQRSPPLGPCPGTLPQCSGPPPPPE